MRGSDGARLGPHARAGGSTLFGAPTGLAAPVLWTLIAIAVRARRSARWPMLVCDSAGEASLAFGLGWLVVLASRGASEATLASAPAALLPSLALGPTLIVAGYALELLALGRAAEAEPPR